MKVVRQTSVGPLGEKRSSQSADGEHSVTDEALDAILNGSEEEADLWSVYRSITDPKSAAQTAFRRAWEALALLRSDGFEKLLEQQTSLEEYAKALETLGLPALRPIFNKVIELIPTGFLVPGAEDALLDHLEAHFETLKELAYRSYDASQDSEAVAAQYIREHRQEFV